MLEGSLEFGVVSVDNWEDNLVRFLLGGQDYSELIIFRILILDDQVSLGKSDVNSGR